MTEPFDPYAILGVDKDATAEQVKKAARKIYLATHPDLEGGDGEAFARARRAEQLLLDEDKRQRFDATGDADESAPDNSRGNAIVVLLKALDAVLMEHLTGKIDVRQFDMIPHLRSTIEGEKRTMESHIEKGAKDRVLLKDIARRFKCTDAGEDPISRSFQTKLANLEVAMKSMNEGLDGMTLALKILDGYTFEFDKPPTADELYAMLTGNGPVLTITSTA